MYQTSIYKTKISQIPGMKLAVNIFVYIQQKKSLENSIKCKDNEDHVKNVNVYGNKKK